MTIIHDLPIKVRSNIEDTGILIDHKNKMTSIEGNYIKSSQSRRMFVESPMNFNIIEYKKSSWIPDFETLHLLGDIDIPENDYEYLRHRGNIDKRVVRENDLVVIDISHYGLEQELKTFIKYSYKNNISILLITDPAFKKELFLIVSILISSSLILNIFNAFKELCGITGYNKIEIFLISSNDVYVIAFNLLSSSFFFQGS